MKECGKICYASEKEALFAKQGKGKRKGSREMFTYYCTKCSCYHITKTRKSK